MISRGNRRDASSLGVSGEPAVLKLINSLNTSACMNKFTFLYLLLGPTTTDGGTGRKTTSGETRVLIWHKV